MPIRNDDIPEDTEDFFSTLTTTDPDVFLGPDEARAIILEDTCDRKFYRHSAHQCTITLRLLELVFYNVFIFVSSHIHKT